LELYAVARIYSGFTVMGTRALGHRHRECGNKVFVISVISANLKLVSRP